MQRRPFVVFEGMDGAGKSTLAKAIAARLEALLLVFPSHTGEVGKLIRRAFTEEITFAPEVLGYLLVADALDFEQQIRSHRETGAVVCDRHATVSGWVYQTEVYSIDSVLGLQQRGQFAAPDVTFILDIPEAVAEERMKERGAKNPIYEREEEGYVSRLRQRYLAYAWMHDDAVILDGRRDTATLVDDVLKVLQNIAEKQS